MSTPLMPALRTGVFAFVTFCAVIVLALSAHVTNTTLNLLGGYFSFAALGIAASVLTLLTLPAMLAIDNMRKGAFTSMILVEVAWLGLLWILFLSTAATASQTAGLNFGRSCKSRSAIVTTTCREFSAIQAFAHLAWLSLFGYLVTLVSFSIVLANRGYDRVWYQSVKETEFNAPPVNVAPQAIPTQQYIAPQNSGAYPPQATPVSGWAGTPQQAPVPVAYPQQA